MSAYAKLPVDDNEVDPDEFDDDIELTGVSKLDMGSDEDDYTDDGDDLHDEEEEEEDDEYSKLSADASGSPRLPLDMLEEQLLWNVWNRWEEPCWISIGITGILVVPLLFLWSYAAFSFLGRLWGVWIFVLHLQLRLSISQWYMKTMTTIHFSHRTLLRCLCSLMTLLEIIACAVAYPQIATVVMESLFRDVDGTFVSEWKSAVVYLKVLKGLGWIVVLLRIPVGVITVSIRFVKQCWAPDEYREWRPTFMEQESGFWGEHAHKRLYRSVQIMNLSVFGLHVLCIFSAISHFAPTLLPFSVVPQSPDACDPLDTTECALPFPSFHHMKEDPSSVTGWRVDLKGLPHLRGGIPFHPKFLNGLDGFSTMAPILFYLEGLKEAHEHATSEKIAELQGPERIEYSITSESITLLVNVETSTLVPHSAEIDYLDPDRPLVMVIPARPLHHGTHYALAVVHAADAKGHKLPPTPGMQALWKESNSERRQRYSQTVLPALHQAAPWVEYAKDHNSQAVQLLFDFVTVSAESQIGTTRKVRDATLHQVDQWFWKDHVETVADIHYSCEDGDQAIARTMHIELEVPWFLRHRKSRYSTLDSWAVENGKPLSIGKAKAIIQIPCSVKRATLGKENGKHLRAIMEYGHGLFYHRGEVQDDFLSEMANRNGYILIAMDWRGMSAFDLPIVMKTLIGNPNLFQAVRDNLIQGYANKLAFQHFANHGLLDWLHFEGSRIPTWKQQKPASVFYGISQGGILGGGYMALAGSTKLIDRGVLGVPGTPFALVMTRSLDFAGYDQLMLLNFYNNRHVRILLSLVQMGWDSVEASGLLAQPLSEPLPPILLQAGLGDSVVPTSAAEALTRAMGGSILKNNPRDIFRIPKASAANATSSGPRVTLTEILYEQEYNSLPLDDVSPQSNGVHFCVRMDQELIQQVEEFVNTGRVIDPCTKDQCRRISADC